MTDHFITKIPHTRDQGISCGAPLFPLDLVSTHPGVELTELIRGSAWIAVKSRDEEGSEVEFILLEFSISDSDGDYTLVTTVFWGYGFSEGLREMRHTYFGTDPIDTTRMGYLFYAPTKAITKAFEHLGKYFDLD